MPIFMNMWPWFSFWVCASSFSKKSFLFSAALGSWIGCLGSVRSNCNSKKWIIWFIMISPAKFQPPNPSITASNCIPRFWSFGRFVWKSKKLPNFFIIEKLFTFLFWILWFEYLKVRHVEFSSNLSLVWKYSRFSKFRPRFCMEKSFDR